MNERWTRRRCDGLKEILRETFSEKQNVSELQHPRKTSIRFSHDDRSRGMRFYHVPLHQASRSFTSYLDGVNARANVAAHLRAAVDRRAIAARNIVHVTRDDDLALEKADVARAHADVQTYLTDLKRLVARPDASDQARISYTHSQVEQAYAPVAEGILALEAAGKRAEAIVKMNDECCPLLASNR